MRLNEHEPAPAQPAAEPVAYTSQTQLSHAAKSPAGYLIACRKPIPYQENIPLYLAAPAHVAAGAKLAALEEALNALRPLSDAVYNDNGNMTVSVPIISAEECIIAYLAVKGIRSALASETEEGPQQ